MKKLTRMKLINWHRFVNCTIPFDDSVLLSGENGAGKSTLLDAIQFVITCSSNAFNKAAHDNGKRKLTGYIRCKTGRENQPYERTGEISAHIALEFYEESRDQYFIVGAVIDSASEGQETVVRYLMDKTRLSDDLFLIDGAPKQISVFRQTNKGIKTWAKTQTEAKKIMKSRFGRIEDKFFQLIPKAMAFKPIDDIKDFVYSYVLDKKEVNIEMLRENVRSYQDLERTLDGVKKRIAKLEQIEKAYQEVENCIRSDGMYDYFLGQADLDITEKGIAASERQVQHLSFRLQEEQEARDEAVNEKEQKQEMETNLRVELRQNSDFMALEQEKRRLLEYQSQEKGLTDRKQQLLKSAKEAAKLSGLLLDFSDVEDCIKEYVQVLAHLSEAESVADVKALLEQVIAYKNGMHNRVRQKIAEVDILLNTKKSERQELTLKIERLKRKQLSYPEAVNRVKSAIEQKFESIGRKSKAYVLCELLEISDEQWRNAVEGYLNTQRFYILVTPESFDIALSVYDELRRQKKAYGVGLINTGRLEAYDTAPADTLATVVTSGNVYAKRYINMVLGRVYMCRRFEELKKYEVAITQGCMKYQNRVASAIKPSVFETPFIGKNAFRVQLEQAEMAFKELSSLITQEEDRRKHLEGTIAPLKTDVDMEIKYRIDVLTEVRQLAKVIKSCKDNIKTLEKNANIIQKQIQLETLERIRKELEDKIARQNQHIGRIEADIQSEKGRSAELQHLQKIQQDIVATLIQQAGDLIALWQREYEKQTAEKTLEQFKDNYDRRKKANQTIRMKAEEHMKEVMVSYKTEHDFGAPATLEGYPEYARVYDRLVTSELLSYEEKVQKARITAEEEFREQFLSKLQENVKQAQTEFKELNKALKDITFSNERYEFLYMPSKNYRQYYEMVMDDFNAMQGASLFSGIFHENHKEVIDELFAKLALDNENESRALEEFTDYRTYMDYDIRIIHSDGNYSLYSKVCEEKSGGETQTPFYVTVAASFVQLYSNNIGGEAIGLVLFDEAFNNMDDERIGGVLQFLKRLPLQVIIAAPPDKIQYISPEMAETLLVLTDEKISYVESYQHEAV